MKLFFKDLGLTRSEFLVYKFLLNSGSSSIRQVSELAQVNRGTTHELLKRLVKKGLVSYRLQGKRRHYLAEPPEKLAYLVQQKKKTLKKVHQFLLKEIIPGLNSQKFIHSRPVVRYYDGDEGVEQVLRDVLQTVKKQKNKKYYAFSAQPLRRHLYRLFPHYTKQRVKYKIMVKVIALGRGGQEAPFSQRKWLKTKTDVSYSSYIIIYSNKLVLISLTKDELPYAVVIHEPGIAQTMKLIFMGLWQSIS